MAKTNNIKNKDEKVLELTNGKFNEFVGKGLVLIDFYADWCMPCLMMAPIMEELSEKFKGKIKFGKLNIEDNQELSQKFRISSIPNMILFNNGQVLKQFVGSMPAEDFEEKLKVFVR